MLITKEVEVGLKSQTIKWYEDKGYEIPRRIDKYGKNRVKKGTKIKVKVEDLTDSSDVPVNVQCDGCGELLEDIRWHSYKKCVKQDGKYYCLKCAMRLYGSVNLKKTLLEKSISFYQWCYTNLSKELADYILLRWDYDLNIDEYGKNISPEDVCICSSLSKGKGYWFKCLDHPEHDSEQKSIIDFTRRQKTSLNCIQCNMIVVTHPELVKYLVNKEDAYKYSIGSNVKIPMKCPNCGFEKMMSLNTLFRGFGCSRCSDGVSYPEKFLFSMLEQLDVIFKVQLSSKTFEWCKTYKYDNYIDNMSCIIETHGIQHYEEIKGSWKMTLAEIQENDKSKEKIAKENGIMSYIILDCKHSNTKWIKNSIIESDLPRVLGFKEDDVNWLECHELACSSLVKIACELWNSEIKNTTYIADKLKVDKHTIVKYLKQGVELGWCDYDPDEEKKKRSISMKELNSRKMICLTTKEVFDSQTEAEQKYSIINISACFGKGRQKSAGRHPETGEKLVWMFYDEYLVKSQIIGWCEEYINSHNGKIICLTTNEIFNQQSEACNKYNISPSCISMCCSNKYKSAGKHPDTGELLKWMNYGEYIKAQKSDLPPVDNFQSTTNNNSKINHFV